MAEGTPQINDIATVPQTRESKGKEVLAKLQAQADQVIAGQERADIVTRPEKATRLSFTDQDPDFAIRVREGGCNMSERDIQTIVSHMASGARDTLSFAGLPNQGPVKFEISKSKSEHEKRLVPSNVAGISFNPKTGAIVIPQDLLNIITATGKSIGEMQFTSDGARLSVPEWATDKGRHETVHGLQAKGVPGFEQKLTPSYLKLDLKGYQNCDVEVKARQTVIEIRQQKGEPDVYSPYEAKLKAENPDIYGKSVDVIVSTVIRGQQGQPGEQAQPPEGGNPTATAEAPPEETLDQKLDKLYPKRGGAVPAPSGSFTTRPLSPSEVPIEPQRPSVTKQDIATVRSALDKLNARGASLQEIANVMATAARMGITPDMLNPPVVGTTMPAREPMLPSVRAEVPKEQPWVVRVAKGVAKGARDLGEKIEKNRIEMSKIPNQNTEFGPGMFTPLTEAFVDPLLTVGGAVVGELGSAVRGVGSRIEANRARDNAQRMRDIQMGVNVTKVGVERDNATQAIWRNPDIPEATKPMAAATHEQQLAAMNAAQDAKDARKTRPAPQPRQTRPAPTQRRAAPATGGETRARTGREEQEAIWAAQDKRRAELDAEAQREKAKAEAARKAKEEADAAERQRERDAAAKARLEKEKALADEREAERRGQAVPGQAGGTPEQRPPEPPPPPVAPQPRPPEPSGPSAPDGPQPQGGGGARGSGIQYGEDRSPFRIEQDALAAEQARAEWDRRNPTFVAVAAAPPPPPPTPPDSSWTEDTSPERYTGQTTRLSGDPNNYIRIQGGQQQTPPPAAPDTTRLPDTAFDINTREKYDPRVDPDRFYAQGGHRGVAS